MKNEVYSLPGPQLPLKLVAIYLFDCPPSFNKNIIQILKVFAFSLRIKCHSLCKDCLPEGIYFEPSEFLSENSKYCPPKNICDERLFAHLDKLRTGPNFMPGTLKRQ